MIRAKTQTDLNWSLDEFEQPRQAAEFFDRFNGAFAVYSKNVHKLYTAYRTELVQADSNLLLIQPEMEEFTAMFHDIDRNAVVRTSVLIYEGSQGELLLSGVMADHDSRRSFPLRDGLYHLFNEQFSDGPFLPVLTHGDLRMLPDQSRPVLQLHGLQIQYLQNLSSFQVEDIVSTMSENLIERLDQV